MHRVYVHANMGMEKSYSKGGLGDGGIKEKENIFLPFLLPCSYCDFFNSRTKIGIACSLQVYFHTLQIKVYFLFSRELITVRALIGGAGGKGKLGSLWLVLSKGLGCLWYFYGLK